MGSESDLQPACQRRLGSGVLTPGASDQFKAHGLSQQPAQPVEEGITAVRSALRSRLGNRHQGHRALSLLATTSGTSAAPPAQSSYVPCVYISGPHVKKIDAANACARQNSTVVARNPRGLNASASQMKMGNRTAV